MKQNRLRRKCHSLQGKQKSVTNKQMSQKFVLQRRPGILEEDAKFNIFQYCYISISNYYKS